LATLGSCVVAAIAKREDVGWIKAAVGCMLDLREVMNFGAGLGDAWVIGVLVLAQRTLADDGQAEGLPVSAIATLSSLAGMALVLLPWSGCR
jgi:hypothetical protein